MYDQDGAAARRGFSLVELLVVLGVIAIISGIAIPILTMFSQNDLDRGAREVYSLLKAAQVYAAAYHVNTAVIYDLDKGPEDSSDVMQDTLRRQAVRTLRAASLVYELPSHMGPYSGYYVPTPKFGGDFQLFKQGYAVLLDVPPASSKSPPGVNAYPWIGGESDAMYHDGAGRDISLLGMRKVPVYWESIPADQRLWDTVEEVKAQEVNYMGHVFQSSGRLDAANNKERYSILFAPSPERLPNERMWSNVTLDDDLITAWFNGSLTGGAEAGLLGVPIEIFRSTGRVRMGEL